MNSSINGEVSHPDAIERRCHKRLLQQIERRRRQLMMLDDDTETSDSQGFQARELPQPRHAMAATPDPAVVHGPSQPDRAICFPHLVMQLPQHGKQALIRGRTGTPRPISPRIEATATDGEGGA